MWTFAAVAQTPIRTGIDATFAPHAMPKLGGGLEGFNIDLANELAKRLGRPITIDGTEFSALIPALNAKKYDFLIAPTTVTHSSHMPTTRQSERRYPSFGPSAVRIAIPRAALPGVTPFAMAGNTAKYARIRRKERAPDAPPLANSSEEVAMPAISQSRRNAETRRHHPA